MAESGATSPTGAPRPQPQRTPDPVIRWVTLAIFGVIIIWLVGVISALMLGVFAQPTAPRTAAERDLMALGGTVQSGKATPQEYAYYVNVLIRAGQLSKAQQALDQALRTTKTDKSYLYAQQAQLDLTQQDYKGTVATADKAIAEAKNELKAFMDANVAANRKRTAGVVVPTSYTDAALAKAQALVASKDYAGAIKAFDLYLAEQPTDSDVLVARGTAKIQVGDKKGAEADFRAALKYIPDYQPALDGLKQIGVAR